MGQYKRRVELQMTKEDYEILEDKSVKAGVSKSEFVRRLIREYVFPEKPDEEFMRLFYGLSQIGNNLNQLARKCGMDRNVDPENIRHEVEDLNRFKEEIRTRYLMRWRE